MKKLLILIFSLSTTLASLAGHAGNIGNIDPLKVTNPVVRVATDDSDYGGMCDCICTNGPWVCNEPACGLHGQACYGSEPSSIKGLDSSIQPRTLPGDQFTPRDRQLPGDQFTPLRKR